MSAHARCGTRVVFTRASVLQATPRVCRNTGIAMQAVRCSPRTRVVFAELVGEQDPMHICIRGCRTTCDPCMPE